MKNEYLTPLEIYINKVFKLLIVVIPSIALCAGLTLSVLHARGYYPTVSYTAIGLFDASCVIYTLIGIFINRHCEDAEGALKPNILKIGKIFIALLMFIQWNFISFMIPSRDFWAYSFFFVLLASSFLDSRFVLIVTAEIVGSMAVSWFIRPEKLLPVRDSLYMSEMALRGVLIILCFCTIWSLTRTIEQRLAGELEKVSDYDTLTLLLNRRKMNKCLEDSAAQKKQNGPFSVILLDIDDFKIVNDTYGHACGDEVLRNVARILRGSASGRGLAFRYGGEEMLVIIRAGEEETFAAAEAIRNRVEAMRTEYDDITVGITVTLGVAEYTDADTVETLLRRADANLYYGKSHGKNCVIR